MNTMKEVIKTENTDFDTDFTDNENGQNSMQDQYSSDDVLELTNDSVSYDIDDDLIYNIIPIKETEISKIEDDDKINLLCPTLENKKFEVVDDNKEAVMTLDQQIITVDIVDQIGIKHESDVDDDVLAGHCETNQVKNYGTICVIIFL